jgi:gas vesicle protein
MQKNAVVTLLLGIGIGALVGTGIALLAAPQSGAQTRKFLGEKGSALKIKAASTVSATVSDTRNRATELIDTVRTRATELTARINRSGNHNESIELPEEAGL